jgi:Ribbon-helix-helix protein, copG family
MVRTTLTLDDDIAARIKDLARERGISFKEAINETLRGGLGKAHGSRRRYRLPTYDMGLRPGIDLEHALRLAAALEDEETMRELELRK